MGLALLHRLGRSHLRFRLVALPRTVVLVTFDKSTEEEKEHDGQIKCLVFFQLIDKFLPAGRSYFIFLWKCLLQLQLVKIELQSLTEVSPCCGCWGSELSADCSGWLVWISNERSPAPNPTSGQLLIQELCHVQMLLGGATTCWMNKPFSWGHNHSSIMQTVFTCWRPARAVTFTDAAFVQKVIVWAWLTSYQVDPPQMLFRTAAELKTQILTHETKENTASFAVATSFWTEGGDSAAVASKWITTCYRETWSVSLHVTNYFIVVTASCKRPVRFKTPGIWRWKCVRLFRCPVSTCIRACVTLTFLIKINVA